MDWLKLIYPPNEVVFCRKPWKAPVLVLMTAALLTFFWGLYLLGMSTEDYSLEDYSIKAIPGTVQPVGNANVPLNGFPLMSPVAMDGGSMQAMQQHISPAVVHIHGRQLPQDGSLPQVLSSGVIVHPEGYVVTTYHNLIARKSIWVDVATLKGIKRYKATVMRASERRDIALLKLDTTDRFLYLKLASGAAPVGTKLYAFGLGMHSQAVSNQGSLLKRGVVTQVGRRNLSRLFSSDAVNSWEHNGGAVINSSFELEGVGLAVTGSTGQVKGYVIPAHIIIKEFKDEIKLTISQPALSGSLPANSRMQATAFARNPQMGINVAAPANVPQLNAGEGNMVAGQSNMDWGSAHRTVFELGGFGLESIVSLAALGLVAGIVGGMMTMGGGIIFVTGMIVFFGYGLLLIRPVAFVTNVFVYGAASLRNRASGLVMWDNVRRLTPWAIGGVLIGYALGAALNDQVVGHLLGVFALLMAAKVLHEIYHKAEDVPVIYDQVSLAEASYQEKEASVDDLLDTLDTEEVPVKSANGNLIQNGLLGLPMGLVSGLLGISGGVIEVPLQRYFAGISLRNAIANSAVVVFWASLCASVVSLLHGTTIGAFEWKVPLSLALIMIPSSYLGGMLGARLLKHVSTSLLNWVYVGLMLLVGVKMLFGQ